MQVFTDKVTPEKLPDLPLTHFIDNRIYTDEEIFRQERTQIFSKVWNFVIHESEIPRPGSFKTVKVAGYPLLLVRQVDGTIKAFYNICSTARRQW
jgi:methanesulfonate monooxygenase large subunit